jgi:hypothetical protein
LEGGLILPFHRRAHLLKAVVLQAVPEADLPAVAVAVVVAAAGNGLCFIFTE